MFFDKFSQKSDFFILKHLNEPLFVIQLNVKQM